jgi:glutathione S-transferase
VAILLEELKVPYTTKIYTTPKLKQTTFLALNRNGLAPVIEDPNAHLLLAEVSAWQAMYMQTPNPKAILIKIVVVL